MMQKSWSRASLRVGVLAMAVVLAGCATAGRAPGQRLDPFENWNRKVFSFNEGLDENVVAPVARAYRRVVPGFVRQSVSNVFANLADGWSAINNFLQAKPQQGLEDMTRFTTNTVFGFLGILDIASEMGLEHHYEDFGQTLGAWGLPAGAYIVWPLLGPSTVRDTAALPLDRSVTPGLFIHDTGWVFGLAGLQLVNARSNFLGASQVINDIALDKYTFVRDAYLQRRRSLVFDGDPPEAAAPGADTTTPPTPAPAPAGAQGSSTVTPADPSGATAIGPARPASAPTPPAPVR